MRGRWTAVASEGIASNDGLVRDPSWRMKTAPLALLFADVAEERTGIGAGSARRTWKASCRVDVHSALSRPRNDEFIG